MNTSKSLDSILHDFAVKLHPYATGKGQASDYDKYKTQAAAAIVEAVEGLITGYTRVGHNTDNAFINPNELRRAIKEWQ